MRTRLVLAAIVLVTVALNASAQKKDATDQQIGPPLIVGTWMAQHPNWSGVVEFFPNGQMAQGDRQSGSWSLESTGKGLQLRLDWDDWQSELVPFASPARFQGQVRKGKLTLIRAGELSRLEAPPRKELVKAPDFVNPDLKEQIAGATWVLKDGKRFTFNPDGTTKASWHDHKGFWHIIGKYEVEMTISWQPKKADRVTVEANGEILRWSDRDFGGIAKRVPREEKPSEEQ
jgi:hypothetical protein